MTKKHDELVEEICSQLWKYRTWVLKYHKEEDRHAEREITIAFAEDLADRTLSAVRDGLELPGEVGRWAWPSDKPATEAVSKWATRITHQERASQLIALSGASKEEE